MRSTIAVRQFAAAVVDRVRVDLAAPLSGERRNISRLVPLHPARSFIPSGAAFLSLGRQFPFSRDQIRTKRCLRRAPHPAHPRARSTTPIGRVFVGRANTKSVLPLIETSGVPIGIWTRDAGIRVPRSTKRRLFRSMDRARAVGYGTSRSTELQSKFPIRPIFQIGFS
jgi:hypothetical protein